MQINQEQNICWENWISNACNFMCAAYVVKNDEGLTLLSANSMFYELLGCSEQTVKLKYANRLGALMEAEPFRKALQEYSETQKVLNITHKFKRCADDAWLETKLFVCKDSDGEVFCCISHDITNYEMRLSGFKSFINAARAAAKQADIDFFDYDFKTKSIMMRSMPALLPTDLIDENNKIESFPEQLVLTQYVPEHHARIVADAFRAVRNTTEQAVCEFQLKHKVRKQLWVRLSLARSSGQRAVGILEDITKEKAAARDYLSETQYFQAMLTEKDAYAQVDITENRITRAGGMWNLYNEIIDKVTYSELIEEFINKVVHPDDRKHYLETMQCENYISSINNGIDKLGCEFRRIVDQNKMMWMQLNAYLFKDPVSKHVLALLTIKNIDALKKQELSLLHDSRTDQLTNVRNRKAAEGAIKEYLAAMPQNELCAFIIMDIDNFKQINDTFGHSEGDRVLIYLTNVLSRSFRQNDIIGRFGGDEFIVFIKCVKEKQQIEKRLEKVYSIIARQSDVCAFTCSAGVIISQGYILYEKMFKNADKALYAAKSAGKNTYVYDEQSYAINSNTALSVNRSEIIEKSIFEDREAAFAAAEQAEEKSFHDFIAEQGDMAYLVDSDTFELLCGNKAFYDRIGMNEFQCSGKTCYELVHKRETPCPFCSKANWSTDKFYLWRNQNMALEQEFIIKNKLVSWKGKEVLLAISVDISNDKSIVDSLQNEAVESHSILSGVQHMTEAETLAHAMNGALESIGFFFRADAVLFWQKCSKEQEYCCEYSWSRNKENNRFTKTSHAISAWIESRNWHSPIMLESPEAVLNQSYDMFQYMKTGNIRNQRWIRIKENDETLGYISAVNISSNFQNIAFLESFGVFIAGELKKRRLIENVIYANMHDDLTDLLSRKSYEEYLSGFKPDNHLCVGVVTANINNLKHINSSNGFQMGNFCISSFADMLRKVFGEHNIFRLNGDEFLVIASGLMHGEIEEKVMELESLVHENGTFSVSIGRSCDSVEKDLHVLIEQAAQAMQVNKKRHKDAFADTVDSDRRKMLRDLIGSIENNEFEVFLQPKVELLQGTVVGAEALVRYKHKERGYIPPANFIGLLEKNNLIRYIDLFVFEEVCKLLERWKMQGLFLPVISVNFSRLTLLEKDIILSMETIISRYDVPRKYVEIEITESIVNMGKSILYQAAHDMYRAGFAISLDDFGTKYTNLSILAELDFSTLKVDKSLVDDLAGKINNQYIMKNIVSMCRDLGMDVLAEGVETQSQEIILQQLNCDMGQGYLYGKPMPIDEFYRKFVSAHRI